MKNRLGAVRKRVCPWCGLPIGKTSLAVLDGDVYHQVCTVVKASFDATMNAREAEDLERKKAGLT